MQKKQLDLSEGQLTKWHEQVVLDLDSPTPHRFLVFVCGRKARKTTFMINELAFRAMLDRNGLTYPFFAPFRKQAKQIVWDDHLARIFRLCNEFGIKYKINLSELTVKFEGGGKLQVDGIDNAEAHRGKSDWGFVCIDEAASTKLRYVWQEIIRPNLQVHKAGGIIGGTPKGYDYFYEVAKMGDHNHVIDDKKFILDKDFLTFSATSYDNQFNDPEEIEAAKRTTTPEYFAREYLAQFTRFSGLVYPEFEEADHVSWFDTPEKEHGDYYFGLDFAVRGYTATVAALVKPNGHVYILDEYKQKADTAENHADNIEQMLEKYQSLDHFVGYADPAGWAKNQQQKDMLWSLADEYLERDFPITQANNEVVGGINYIKQLLTSKRLHIHGRCKELIAEFYQYQWKEQGETRRDVDEEPEKVRKINDHLLDCLRYLVYSKPSAPEEEETPRATIFPAQFELKITKEDETNKDVFEELYIPSYFE